MPIFGSILYAGHSFPDPNEFTNAIVLIYRNKTGKFKINFEFNTHYTVNLCSFDLIRK